VAFPVFGARGTKVAKLRKYTNLRVTHRNRSAVKFV